MWTALGAQTKLPQFSAEAGSVFIEKAGELDLDLLDVGLEIVIWHIGQQEWYTYETLLFNKIVYHLNHNVVFVTKYLGYLTCYPSAQKFEISFWKCSIAEQGCILLDHLRPHFLHIHLLVKFWRKLSRPLDFCVHRSGHGC